MAIIMLFAMVSGCAAQTEKNNGGQLETSPTETTSENVTVEVAYNDWSITSKSEYKIIEKDLYARGENVFFASGHTQNTFSEKWNKIAENVQHVEANDNAVLYLTYDGNIYGLGKSSSNIFYDQNSDNLIDEPVLLFTNCKYFSLSNNFVVAIKNDNTLWFLGESRHGQSTKIEEAISEPQKIAENIQFVKAFGYSVAWIDQQGNLYLCGDNSFNQIGNGHTGSGEPEQLQDIVSSPFCALKNCIAFVVTDNMVVTAKTDDGTEYIWGNYHSPVPTNVSNEFPAKAEATSFSNSINFEVNNTVSEEGGIITFYKGKDDKGNLSIIYKLSIYDQESQVIQSGLVPPFTMSLIGKSLLVSSKNDNCLYLLSYSEISGGRINNIKMSVLYDHFAIPVYVKDASHLVIATPDSNRELILNSQSGETTLGDFWEISKIQNIKLTENKAKELVIHELSKDIYTNFDNQKHNFSKIESCSLQFMPNLQKISGLYSMITPNSIGHRKDMTWCYDIIVSDARNDLASMEVIIDANSSTIYALNYTSD